MTKSENVTETYDFVTETDEAILILSGKQKVWLPKSKIEYEDLENGTCEVEMPEWLALDKGLI